MKPFLYILLVCGLLIGCNTSKTVSSNTKQKSINVVENDTVSITNEDLEYEIIIIEPGFNTWLIGMAKPEGYYSQEFLESRNQIYVAEWNRRVLQPLVYDANLYEMQINYDPLIDYGYEVNYKLYNYFIYFQLHYKQQLSGLVPRI